MSKELLPEAITFGLKVDYSRNKAWEYCFRSHPILMRQQFQSIISVILTKYYADPENCNITALTNLLDVFFNIKTVTAAKRIEILISIGLFDEFESDTDRRYKYIFPTVKLMERLDKYNAALKAALRFYTSNIDDLTMEDLNFIAERGAFIFQWEKHEPSVEKAKERRRAGQQTESASLTLQ